MIARTAIALLGSALLAGGPQNPQGPPTLGSAGLSQGAGVTRSPDSGPTSQGLRVEVQFRPGGGIAATPDPRGPSGPPDPPSFRVRVNPPGGDNSTTLRIDRFQIVGFDTIVTLELDDVTTRLPGAVIRVLRADEGADGLPLQFAELPQASGSCTSWSLDPPLLRCVDSEVVPGKRYFYTVRADLAGVEGPLAPELAVVVNDPVVRSSFPEDVTVDGRVTGRDLLEVAYRNGIVAGPNQNYFLPNADVDGNSVINVSDLRQTAGQLGNRRP